MLARETIDCAKSNGWRLGGISEVSGRPASHQEQRWIQVAGDLGELFQPPMAAFGGEN